MKWRRERLDVGLSRVVAPSMGTLALCVVLGAYAGTKLRPPDITRGAARGGLLGAIICMAIQAGARLRWRWFICVPRPDLAVPATTFKIAEAPVGVRVLLEGRITRGETVKSPISRAFGVCATLTAVSWDDGGTKEARPGCWRPIPVRESDANLTVTDGSGASLRVTVLPTVDVERDHRARRYESPEGTRALSREVRESLPASLRRDIEASMAKAPLRLYETVVAEGDTVCVIGILSNEPGRPYRSKGPHKADIAEAEIAFLGTRAEMCVWLDDHRRLRRLLEGLLGASALLVIALASLLYVYPLGAP